MNTETRARYDTLTTWTRKALEAHAIALTGHKALVGATKITLIREILEAERNPTPKTEQTRNGLATYHEPTFRTYAPQWGTGPNDTMMLSQLCEQFIGGRWESFISIKQAKDAQGQRISVRQALSR